MTLPTSLQGMTEYLKERGASAVTTTIGPMVETATLPMAQLTAGVALPGGRATTLSGVTVPSLDLQTAEEKLVALLTQAGRDLRLIP